MATPVYKNGSVTYNGKTYSTSQLQSYLTRERGGKTLTATEALVLGAFKRGSQPSSSRYSGTSYVSGVNPASSLYKNITQVRSKASSQYSGPIRSGSQYQSGINPTLTSQYQKLPSTQAYTKPAGSNPGSAPGTNLGGGTSFSDIMGQNYLQPTIDPYKMRSDEELRNEASTAAAGIYNPIMNALIQRQQDYEKARQLGREDLAAQYANQIADLKALALSAQTMISQQQESSNKAYTTSMQNLANQTLQSKQANEGNYAASQNILGGELGQLGLNEGNTPNAALLRDKNFADAMLQGVGNIGQTGLAGGQSAANAAMSQLAANSQSQFGSLQGQAGIVKDQALRDIDRDTLEKVMAGKTDIGKTQSDWNSKAYELMKALQGTEWSKYMESGGAAFGQQQANAELGLNAAQIAAGSDAANQANMNPVQLGQSKLNAYISGLDAEKQKGFTDVWNLMTQPGLITTAGQPTPFGELTKGYQPSLQQFIGDNSMAERQDDAFKRAWLSLRSRGLVDETGKDAPWEAFKQAMISVMIGNKNYNPASLGY